MDPVIRAMTAADKPAVLEMMRVFYASPALLSDGSEEIFAADVDQCTGESPYLEGYVFEEDGGIAGYAMLAKSFSTEFGRPCVWIEDLYVKPEHRKRGIGSLFLRRIGEKYRDCVLRLEAEPENESAIRVYRKCGFEPLPYLELKK